MNQEPTRPNVLMFIPHDLGDYLHCYGHSDVKSPNLDRLAGEGVRLSEHFAAAPECTPSRAGLYTGLYTHQNGLMGLTGFGWEYNRQAVHLAKRFWNAGYDTHLFGHQHETGMNPSRLGYNDIHAQLSGRHRSDEVCPSVVDFVNNVASQSEKPWFACVGFQADVHRPWQEETTFSPEQVNVPPFLPDNPDVRRDLAIFYQAIENMDTNIGRVLAALDASPLAENTIVVFTVDHGAPFPRAKSTYYDPGIHVPMIMRWPGHLPAGAVYDQLISNLDYFPTILDACGIDLPAGLVGRSYLPLLLGKPYQQRQEVCGALFFDACYDPMHYVRTDRYKYIKSFAVRPEDIEGLEPDVVTDHKTGNWIRADDWDVQSSLSWKSMKGPFLRPPPEELYDLAADPNEQNNLIDDPDYTEVLTDMRARLDVMMKETNSPLLTGHVDPGLSSSRNKPLR